MTQNENDGEEKINIALRSLQEVKHPKLCPHFLQSGCKEEVSHDFLENISKQIQDKRPLSWLTKDKRCINTRCHQVECLPDLCFVIDPKIKVNSPTFSIEIKPKKGFLCESPLLCPTYKDLKTSICRFCMHQVMKLRKGTVREKSQYCPLDLFSGNPLQMKHALISLMRTPQRNLRIFKDGAVVWSNEIKSNVCEDLLKFFPLSKHSINKDDWNADENEYNDAGGFIECVISCLCHIPPGCASTCVMPKHVPAVNAKICKESSFKTNESAESFGDLPSGCVLDQILQKQLQDDLDIEGIWPLYQKIARELESGCLPNRESVLEDTAGIHTTLTKIHEFLEARTFMDCSVIIAIQPIPILPDTNHEPSTNSIQCCHLLTTTNGRKYQFSVSVIDLDAKLPKKIKKYIIEDMNVLECYSEST